MGQARRRGSFEERCAQSSKRREAERDRTNEPGRRIGVTGHRRAGLGLGAIIMVAFGMEAVSLPPTISSKPSRYR